MEWVLHGVTTWFWKKWSILKKQMTLKIKFLLSNESPYNYWQTNINTNTFCKLTAPSAACLLRARLPFELSADTTPSLQNVWWNAAAHIFHASPSLHKWQRGSTHDRAKKNNFNFSGCCKCTNPLSIVNTFSCRTNSPSLYFVCKLHSSWGSGQSRKRNAIIPSCIPQSQVQTGPDTGSGHVHGGPEKTPAKRETPIYIKASKDWNKQKRVEIIL